MTDAPGPALPCRPLPPLAARTLPAVMARALATCPDRIAVQDTTRALSYAALQAEALALAGGLARLGVARQEAVLLMLDNHADYVACWLALGLTARVEVPVNTAYVGTILAHVINTSGARVMVLDAAYVPAVLAVADALTHLTMLVVRGDMPADTGRLGALPYAALPDTPQPVADVAPQELMAIMYTSGTTGLSKGVRITHAHAYGYCTPDLYGACGPGDVSLVLLPLFHIGGQWKGVYNALIAQATAVVLPRFSASRFWEDVRQYRVTYTMLLGAMVEFLDRQPARPDDADHSLRRIVMVPVIAELDSFKARFGIPTVSTGYGSTEASLVILSPMGGAEPGRIGWPRPDFEVRLVDADDNEVPRGTAGELVVRPREPWVMMAGYHGMPEATAEAWRNLWFHTGDMMRQDDRGMFAFVDRAKDALRRRGENISSFEVEREIYAHPQVRECAVVAAASDATEDDILACVVLAPGATLDAPALHAFLQGRMPRFMVPRYIRLMDSLPKTPTEKIRKQALRAEGPVPGTFDAEIPR